MSACAAQPSAAALAGTCPGDRGNNPSCGFISPPLPSTSPMPLRSRHRPFTQRRSSPLFRNIFRDRLGHFSDAPAQPTPGSPHNAHNGPTSSASPKENRREKLHAGGPGPGTTFLLPLPLPVGRQPGAPRPTVERIVNCSPVVFNDIKHLTATCDRRARFRHPVTARGSSHALLPWALPRERATSISAMISVA